MVESKKTISLSQTLNSGINKYGTAIVSNLAIALRTSNLYGFAHSNVTSAISELHEFLDSFTRLEGDAEISRIDDFLFINDVRLKVDLGAIQTCYYVVQVMKEREIGSLAFKQGAGMEELAELIGLLNVPVRDAEKPWEDFQKRLAEASLSHIEATKLRKQHELREDFTDDVRLLACSLYFRAIRLMDEQLESVRTRGKANLRRLKRVIQSMVDMVIVDPSTLLALVNIKDYGSVLASHSVNVAVLSVALGAKLGLSKKQNGDLGIAALLHDIGKCDLPEELCSTPAADLDRENLQKLKDHVYSGVDVLINQRISDATVKSINVAFLHHLRFDGTGYPRSQLIREQNVFSRLVAVADLYDSRSRLGAGGTPPSTPDAMLHYLMDGAGTEFDPLAVKAFIHLVGLYPVGSIVCLDSGEIATVAAPSMHPRYLDRPTVRVFCDAGGQRVDELVDLMQRDEGGSFRKSILKLYQQQEVQLQMDEFLSVI